MIVINTSYQIAPWADYLYACDAAWWEVYATKVKEIFSGELWTQDVNARHHGVNVIQGAHEPGLGRDRVHFGGNSGYQAVNLAYLWAADVVLLMGYDMQRTNNQTHWHGDHPKGLNRGSPLADWVGKFGQLAKDLEMEGVTVLNLSRDTALECFQRRNLEEVLCGSYHPAPELVM